MRLALLLALALYTGSAFCTESAPAVLDGCIHTVFSGGFGEQRDRALPIDVLCPELVDGNALSSLHLQGSADDTMTTAQLLDLRDALRITGEAPESPDGAGNAKAALGAVLAKMDIADEAPPSLWERFKRWVERHFQSDSQTPAWLAEWLDGVSIPDELADAILKGAILLVILLAVGIVLNELARAEWGKRSRRARTAAADAVLSRDSEPLDWNAIKALPPARQAVASLRYLIALMSSKGILPLHRAWTNHEYAMAVHRHLPETASAFRLLADWADRIAYGSELPDEATAEALLCSAGELRSRLEGQE